MGLNKTLRIGQSMKIGDEIEVRLTSIGPKTATIMIEAPIDILIKEGDELKEKKKNARLSNSQFTDKKF